MSAAGRRPNFVALEDRPSGRPVRALDPATLYVDVQPAAPGDGDEDHVGHTVFGPYHSQVDTDTVLVWGDRELMVRGVQNVGERGREMVLRCHEVKTPGTPS